VRRAGFDQRLGERLIFNARVAIERHQALHPEEEPMPIPARSVAGQRRE
jgi:hypothetical protein